MGQKLKHSSISLKIVSNYMSCHKEREAWRSGWSIRLWIHEWLPGVGSSQTGAKNLCELPVPLSKALYSNCSVVRRLRKAVGPVYMYLNINTSVHVKERHRLFEKSRGSSRYCWLYFKTTLIYSRFQSMGQGRLARLSP